jgi:trehalose 6-phosphate phosphatase
VYERVSGSDNAALTRRVTEMVGAGRAGLVTDIDGTISAIVARPEEAMVLPLARTALAGLKQRLTLVAVVTGRSVADARQMVGIDDIIYVGNHGLEVYANGRAETVAEARPWVPRLAAVLDQVQNSLDPSLKDGVIVENKGATASLHYRLTPDPDQARIHLLEILARTATPNGLRVEEGRRVLNLLPPLMVTKGSAVTWMVREHGLEQVVYVGDDITDAHAFRALDVLRQTGAVNTLSIGVVGPETPPSVRQLADASVPSVSAVAELFEAVLARLEAGDTMNSRAPSAGSD